jgi:hypothetical protein
MFCASGLVFGGTGGVGTYFHVLRARTHFRRYQGRQFPFSSFARPDSFTAVPRALGPLFIFCASRLVFGGASFPVFMFCAPGLIFGGTEYVRSRFHIFRFRTCFWRGGGRQIPFSWFALFRRRACFQRYTFSGPVFWSLFMFCVTELIFGGTKGFRSRFHVLHSRTIFSRYGGHRVPFSCLALPDSFPA